MKNSTGKTQRRNVSRSPSSRESHKKPARRPTISKTQIEEEGTQVERKKGRAPTRRKRNATVTEKTEGEQQAMKASLRQFALTTVEKNIPGLLSEFTDIKTATAAQPVMTAFHANPDKNRYKDVFCADETRVILNWPPGNTNDYIHANYVSIRGEKKFICTQGPTEKTVDDFWRLVWEQKCRAVVMLCGVFEQGKKKCELYYPEKPNDMMKTQSNIMIKNTGVTDAEKILTISTFELTADGDTIVVKHYLWNAWPDRGVPQNIMACLRLLAQLKSFSPVLVHCSAGIGRTGTIVGLEMAQQSLNFGETLNMASLVKELRAFRHGSVQTDIQYVYMHRVLLGLAENKKVVKREELAPFYDQYEAFLKSRGC